MSLLVLTDWDHVRVRLHFLGMQQIFAQPIQANRLS